MTAVKKTELETDQIIKAARELLKPDEVILHKIPSWLTKRLRAYGKKEGLFHADIYEVARLLGGDSLFGSWVDHYGSSKGGPSQCCRKQLNFVSEPYDFNSKFAKALDHFCETLGGLEWHVSSDTWWFPGSTVRITIHEKSEG